MVIPSDWRPREIGTLVYLSSKGRVLLIRKKRGHGAGKVNAPGGRVEPGETPLECARREVLEEVCVDCRRLEPAAELKFHDTGNGYSMLGFVFRSDEFSGEPTETDEARPFWCGWDVLPYDDMWEDDRYWLPYIRANQPVRGEFLFDHDKLIAHRIKLVDKLEFA